RAPCRNRRYWSLLGVAVALQRVSWRVGLSDALDRFDARYSAMQWPAVNPLGRAALFPDLTACGRPIPIPIFVHRSISRLKPRTRCVMAMGNPFTAIGQRSGRRTQLTLNLALQGGGAQGAFTWGVLDRILECGEVGFEGISGAFAGALNAVALASGWLANGR